MEDKKKAIADSIHAKVDELNALIREAIELGLRTESDYSSTFYSEEVGIKVYECQEY